MTDEFLIKININGRYYPLTIDRSQEWRYRDAASMVNSSLSDFKNDYPAQDAQDFLSMTALQLAMKIIELEENASESPIVQELRQMDEKVSRFLSTEE